MKSAAIKRTSPKGKAREIRRQEREGKGLWEKRLKQEKQERETYLGDQIPKHFILLLKTRRAAT